MNRGREVATLRHASHETREQRKKEIGPDLEREADEHKRGAISELEAAVVCLFALFGQGAALSSWVIPFSFSLAGFIVTCAVALGTVLMVNDASWDLTGWQIPLVGLGIPAAIIILKAGGVAVGLGNFKNLFPAAERGKTDLIRSLAAVFITALIFAALKAIPQIPSWCAFFGLCCLEVALGFAASACLVLTLVYSRVPTHLFLSSRHNEKAQDCVRLMRILDIDEDEDSAPPPPAGALPAPSGNGEPALEEPKQKRFPTGVVSLLLAAFLSIATVAHAAGFVSARLYVDRSGSLYDVELHARLYDLGPALAKQVAPCESDAVVEIYLFDGLCYSLRVATQRFTFDSLSVTPCTSPFRLRCEFLRDQAKAVWLKQREPKLDSLSSAIAHSGSAPVKPAGATCLGCLLSSASEGEGLALVVTDGAGQNCLGDELLPARPGRRVLVLVVAKKGDPPARSAALIRERTQKLRALGYNAIDARSLPQVKLSLGECK